MVFAASVLAVANLLLVPSATASASTTPALSAVDITPAAGCPNSISVEVLFSAPLSASETVQLTSSNAAIKVPATATFQAPGLGGGVSGITVSDVTAKTPVTITATFDGAKVSASYTLLPSWSSGTGKITLSQEFPGPYYSPATGNDEIFVNLSDPVASGDILSVSATASNSSAVSDLLTPTIITSGCELGIISFDVPGQTSAVHATVTVSVDGVTSSIPVTIEPYLESFTLPTSMEGGASATGTINMAGPVDTATTVNLDSTSGILSVPGTVTIPAGSASATFPITTERSSENGTANITAILGINANSASFESQGIEVLTWGTLPAPPRSVPPVRPAPPSPVRLVPAPAPPKPTS
jgi:hypothetical protein